MLLRAMCSIKVNGHYVKVGETFEIDQKTGEDLLRRGRAIEVGAAESRNGPPARENERED